MTAFVIDASITLAWCLTDELSAEHQSLLERVADQCAIVPAIWPLEVANAVLSAAHSGRIDHAAVPKTMVELEALPVRVDTLTSHHAWHATLRLAATHRLTSYDAAYLELAQRTQLPLVTLDVRLARACRSEGLAVLAARIPAA